MSIGSSQRHKNSHQPKRLRSGRNLNIPEDLIEVVKNGTKAIRLSQMAERAYQMLTIEDLGERQRQADQIALERINDPVSGIQAEVERDANGHIAEIENLIEEHCCPSCEKETFLKKSVQHAAASIIVVGFWIFITALGGYEARVHPDSKAAKFGSWIAGNAAALTTDDTVGASRAGGGTNNNGQAGSRQSAHETPPLKTEVAGQH